MKTLVGISAMFEEVSLPERKICIARELTKKFEETLHGTPKELVELLEKNEKKQKGEFVVMVEGK